jgi:hypothetical protein
MLRHGLCPAEDTPPELLREYVNDLYLIEIRKLRARMRAADIPKELYASQVAELRDRYPILSLPIHLWIENDR